MQTQEYVKIESDTVYIDSRVYCRDIINVDHGDWSTDTLKKHQEIIEQYFGAIRFETDVLKHASYKGSTRQTYAMLTEPQCNFALTLSRNTPETMHRKAELIADFERAKALLKTQLEAQFQAKYKPRMDSMVCDERGNSDFEIRYKLAPNAFTEDSYFIWLTSGIASRSYFNRACRDDLIDDVDYIEGEVRGDLILTPKAAMKMLVTLRSRKGMDTRDIPKSLKDMLGRSKRKINRRKPQSDREPYSHGFY